MEDKIKVLNLKLQPFAPYPDGRKLYAIITDGEIPPEKHEAVKKAIEDAINDKK